MPGGCYLENRHGPGYWNDVDGHGGGSGSGGAPSALPAPPPPVLAPPGFPQRIPVTFTMNLSRREIRFVRRFVRDLLENLPDEEDMPEEPHRDEDMPGAGPGEAGAPDGDRYQ